MSYLGPPCALLHARGVHYPPHPQPLPLSLSKLASPCSLHPCVRTLGTVPCGCEQAHQPSFLGSKALRTPSNDGRCRRRRCHFVERLELERDFRLQTDLSLGQFFFPLACDAFLLFILERASCKASLSSHVCRVKTLRRILIG